MKTHGSVPEEQVLVLLTQFQEITEVQAALGQAGLACRICASPRELYQQLDQTAAAVVSREALTAPVMTRLVQALDGKPERAEYPFVLLLNSPGDETSDAIRLLDLLEPFGNLTVVERPLRPLPLVSAVRTAVRTRRAQRRAREVVQRLQMEVHDRDQQLARLVHKLRTPLSTILNATEILDRVGSPNQAAVEQRGLLRRQTLLLARQLENVQEPAETILAEVSLSPRPLDLKALLERVIQRVRAALKARQDLILILANEPVWIEGDAPHLEEVLTGLVHHAVEQADPGGGIEVEVEIEAGQALCRIRTSTVGTTEGNKPDAEAPALQRARQLVGMHGGSVRLSQAGSGSEIEVRLPRVETPARVEEHRQADALAPGRLLLVEDDEECRESLQFLLRLQGIEVAVARDGQQALAMALEQAPDVVLLDIDLPDLSGFEVARRIREALADRVRLVALTGLGRECDRRKAREVGFDDCLVKPVPLQELFRALVIRPTVEA